MLFVGLFKVDRAKDLEFWSVFWQGPPPPADMELVAAYNLLTDLRVIVFKAETIAAIRWWDKLNIVGSFECHPALDQTRGYLSVVARDLDEFAAHQRSRGVAEETIKTNVAFRAEAHQAPSVWSALEVARTFRERGQSDGWSPS
jgi:hypothetical protein